MKLTELLKDILIEADSKKPKQHKGRKEGPIRPNVKEAIKNSIENHWPIFIEYEGDEETAPGARWVEPYVWGLRINTENNILRAYQYKGQSVHQNDPPWKTFRLDRISKTAPLTSATFSKPRSLYNPNGDKHMTKIFIQAKFGGDGGAKGPDRTGKGPDAPVDINSPEIKKTAEIIRKNVDPKGEVDFDKLQNAPEFARDSKMKRALDVLKKLLSKVGKGIIKGLQNLHLKENETN